MASGSSRAYKLQLSAEGIDLFLNCHHRLCHGVGDLLPYGSTLFVAVSLLNRLAPEDAASVLLEPGIERLGGKTIRYVGTSRTLSPLVEELGQKILETGAVFQKLQVWRIFVAAMSCMREAKDSEITHCYRFTVGSMRADHTKD
jgi:hypothetical protein